LLRDALNAAISRGIGTPRLYELRLMNSYLDFSTPAALRQMVSAAAAWATKGHPSSRSRKKKIEPRSARSHEKSKKGICQQLYCKSCKCSECCRITTASFHGYERDKSGPCGRAIASLGLRFPMSRIGSILPVTHLDRITIFD
jgi:hypothetical protein